MLPLAFLTRHLPMLCKEGVWFSFSCCHCNLGSRLFIDSLLSGLSSKCRFKKKPLWEKGINMVTKLCYCRRMLPEFRGYLTRIVSIICSHKNSIQNHCIQNYLNVVLIRNGRTRPAEGAHQGFWDIWHWWTFKSRFCSLIVLSRFSFLFANWKCGCGVINRTSEFSCSFWH